MKSRVLRKEKGFTLVEMMVVITIIVILVAISLYMLMGTSTKAKIGRTKGIVGALVSALESYYQTFKEFPPDGYDEGAQPEGSAALVYYLCRPLEYEKKEGAQGAEITVTREAGPFLKDYKLYFFLRPPGLKTIEDVQDAIEDTSNIENDLEFRDGWGNAIEYDRVQVDKNNQLVDRSIANSGHRPHIGNRPHAKDPREVDTKIWELSNEYFLWSNGPVPSGAQTNWTPRYPIGNWNLKE